MTPDQKAHEEKAHEEKSRVTDFLAETIKSLELDNGDIRFFSAAFLVAAVQLHIEVEGVKSITAALSRIGVNELAARGHGSKC